MSDSNFSSTHLQLPQHLSSLSAEAFHCRQIAPISWVLNRSQIYPLTGDEFFREIQADWNVWRNRVKIWDVSTTLKLLLTRNFLQQYRHSEEERLEEGRISHRIPATKQWSKPSQTIYEWAENFTWRPGVLAQDTIISLVVGEWKMLHNAFVWHMIWFNKQLKHFALVIVLLVMWDYNASGFKNSRILHFVFVCNFFAPSHNEGACEGKKRIQELRSKETSKCNNKIVKHFPTTSKYSIVLCCLLRWILLCVWQSEGKPKISLELLS